MLCIMEQVCIIWANSGCSIKCVLVLSREFGLLETSLGMGELVFVLWDYSVCYKTYLPYGVIVCVMGYGSL